MFILLPNHIALFAIIACLSFFSLGFSNVYGVEVFSKNEKPFGIPYDEWIGKFENWGMSLTPEQSESPNGSCLINKSDSMVMVFDPAIAGKHDFECDISSKDGIMIPSWNGVFENNNKDDVTDNTPVGQLSNMTKEQLDLGAVTSDVKVDGKTVAKLDEITTMSSNNIVNTKVNTMDNFTEIFANPSILQYQRIPMCQKRSLEHGLLGLMVGLPS